MQRRRRAVADTPLARHRATAQGVVAVLGPGTGIDEGTGRVPSKHTFENFEYKVMVIVTINKPVGYFLMNISVNSC